MPPTPHRIHRRILSAPSSTNVWHLTLSPLCSESPSAPAWTTAAHSSLGSLLAWHPCGLHVTARGIALTRETEDALPLLDALHWCPRDSESQSSPPGSKALCDPPHYPSDLTSSCPSVHPALPLWPLDCSVSLPGPCLSQGLCAHCSLCPEYSSQGNPLDSRPYLLCLLGEAVPHIQSQLCLSPPLSLLTSPPCFILLAVRCFMHYTPRIVFFFFY